MNERPPCDKCEDRRSCEERDYRCQEWIGWFYRDFRRRWRELRRVYGIRDVKKVLRYRAPYEPEDAAAAREKKPKERETDPWIRARIEELAALYRERTPSASAKAAEVLRRIKRERRLTQTMLSQASKVSPTTVNRLFRGEEVPKPETWEKILAGLESLGARDAPLWAGRSGAGAGNKDRGTEK